MGDTSSSIPAEPAGNDPILEGLTAYARQLDGKHPNVTRTLKFDLMADGIYRFVIVNGACRVESGDGPADATAQLKAADGYKLFAGKLNPMVAVMTGKIKIKGDPTAFMILQP